MFPNLWKIGYFEGRPILVDNVHQRHIVEQKFIIMVDVKFQRGEFNRLVNQVNVVLHPKLKSINCCLIIAPGLMHSAIGFEKNKIYGGKPIAESQSQQPSIPLKSV